MPQAMLARIPVRTAYCKKDCCGLFIRSAKEPEPLAIPQSAHEHGLEDTHRKEGVKRCVLGHVADARAYLYRGLPEYADRIARRFEQS